LDASHRGYGVIESSTKMLKIELLCFLLIRFLFVELRLRDLGSASGHEEFVDMPGKRL